MEFGASAASYMSKRIAETRVGISGWRGKFCPKGLPQRRELEFASGVFNSVEITRRGLVTDRRTRVK